MFSASNNNKEDVGDDPYGFDIDFSATAKLKKPSSYDYNDFSADSSDDNDNMDAATAYASSMRKKKSERSMKKTSRKREGGASKDRQTSGSALDRASAYLSKYKNTPAAATTGVSKSRGKKPPKSPKDDFNDFMAESDDDGQRSNSFYREKSDSSVASSGSGMRSRRARPKSLKHSPQETFPPKQSTTPTMDGKSSSQGYWNDTKEDIAAQEDQVLQGGVSLGNTLKSKLSSPVIGVLKSGSDIKDIYKSGSPPKPTQSSPLYTGNSPSNNSASNMRDSFVSNGSNISENLEESVADEELEQNEARGKIMGFDQLGVFSGIDVPSPSKPYKVVTFRPNEKVRSGGW